MLSMEYINLKAQYQYLKKDIDENIESVLHDADFILGDKVVEFEQRLAEYVGVKYAITCSNGTAALQLIYMAYGIGKGDAVFCPDMTFIASIEPAVMLGASPVFCEIDKKTYNIDVISLEKQIKAVLSEAKLVPKAIVAVDFLGNPADYHEIRKIADKYNLLIIEDAAQGISSSYQGKKCGSFGDVAATSFFPSKPLGCYGDGGAIFTNNEVIAKTIFSLRVHGKGKSKYDNIRIGINSRLDTLQAAVMLPKLHELPVEIEKRQEAAARYRSMLEGYVQLPYVEEGNVSAYAQYVICATGETERDKIRKHLEDKGIPTILYYPVPMHLLPVFKEIENYQMDFSNTIQYSKNSFGIPFSPYITVPEQEEVATEIIRSLTK